MDLTIEKGWDILALEIAPDHVHLFISVKPTDPKFVCIKRGGFMHGRQSIYSKGYDKKPWEITRKEGRLHQLVLVPQQLSVFNKHPLFLNHHSDPFFLNRLSPPHLVMKAVKGRTSYYLRREFPQLKKLPSLWTNSYFVSTAGNVSSETIKRYIEDPHHS